MKTAEFVSGLPDGATVVLSEGSECCQDNIIGRPKLFFNSIIGTYRKLISRFISEPSLKLSLALIGALAVISPQLAEAASGDILASQRSDANATFGHGSTVEWLFYIAEVVVALGLFIKSRSPLVFTGCIMMILITRALFGVIGT